MFRKALIITVLLAGLHTRSYGQPGTTLVITPTTVPDGLYGSSYSNQQLSASGGTTPYTFAVSAGSLPLGMSLSGDGIISGTPAAAGTYTFTVTAQDNSPGPTPNTGSQDYTLVVDPAALTVTANDAGMTYGGAVPALSVMYAGFVNNDNASSLTTAPTVTTTATAASPAGTYPITASGAVDQNYTISYQPGTLTIGKATLTVTADNKAMPLGGPVPALTISYSGFVNSDDASSLTSQPTATTTATAASGSGTYPITPAGGSSSNYSFKYVNGTLAVAQAVLTITANPAGSVYGAPLASGGALTVTYSGFVNGDGPANLTRTPTIGNSATPGSPVGSYTLTPSGAADPNYAIQYVTGVYTISPAPLTITGANQTITYGGTIPALSVTYAGFVHGDNASSLTTPPIVTTTATSASPAGSYPVIGSGAADPNYTITYQPGTLTIGKASLTVTADNKAMPLGGPVPALTVSYTGFVNGDNVASLTTLPTATTTATAASPAGNYPITPSGGVSSSYNFKYVNGTLSVAQAVLTITANPAGSVYGAPLATGSALTVTYSGFVNGDGPSSLTKAPAISNSATAGSPVGNYTLKPSGAVDPNYAIQYVAGVYTIRQAPLTITATSQTMTYGGTVPAPGLTYTGFVNGDKATSLTTAPTVTTTATSASPAGAYPITVSGAADPNYAITYNPGTLTINPASLFVTAAAAKKVYGTPDPTFTYTATGYLNGDNSSIFTGSLSRTAGENVGTHPITIGTLSAGGNYTIRFSGNNLTITIASQTITWTQSLIVGCNATTQVQMNATASSGLPVTYTVANSQIATISGSVLTLLQPGSTVVTAHQTGDANHTAAPVVTDTIFYQAASLVNQHWNDALFFDNSSGDYVSWQWYKNDSAITGATEPYYSEEPALNGQYFVIATNKDSQQVQSCTLNIMGDAAIPGGIKVQPNPVGKGQTVTITCNYTAAALQGAMLQVVDLTGAVRQQVSNVQPAMQVTMPSDNGIFIINLLLANGSKASVNVLVATQ